MSDWCAMGGHGSYIWASYLRLALAVAVALRLIRRRRTRASEHARVSAEDAESA